MSIRLQEHPSRSIYIDNTYVGKITYYSNGHYRSFMYQPVPKDTVYFSPDDLEEVLKVLREENAKL